VELEIKLMTISSGEIIKRGKNGATCFQSLAMSFQYVRRKMAAMEIKADGYCATSNFLE